MTIKPWQAPLAIAIISLPLTLMAVPESTWSRNATVSLACGVAATAMMAAACVLAARWRWVESAFGGLDRVYLAHKWLGVWALGLASYHMVFKAGIGLWETAAIVEWPRYYARLVRQLSFVALMFIVLLALNRRIRYSIWRLWHKLSGPLFIVVILHWLTFASPIGLSDPAGIWLAATSALGVVAAAYKLLLYPLLANHAEYRVTGVTPGSQAVHLRLEPVGRPLAFQPGQFGFLRISEDGLREPHPFTIASGPTPDGRVDFVIRALGDYTARLVSRCCVDMHADVYGPYGCFRRPSKAGREIWIGGGVGISPFIAWLQDPAAGGFDKVTLFYFYTPGREFPEAETLAEMARQRGAELVAVSGGPSDPAFVRRFAEIAAGDDPHAISVSFCGPQGLLEQVKQRMREHGIPESRLQHELFDFR